MDIAVFGKGPQQTRIADKCAMMRNSICE